MNLLGMRIKFRELSGRFDLVNDDYSDNGADFFINEGRKFLDRLDETQKSWGSCFRFIETGHFSVSFPYCRAIKEVWIATSEKRWQLKKKKLQDMMKGYLSGIPSSRTVGSPKYYTPCITRNIPENAALDTMEAFVGFVEIPTANANEYNSIMVNVPVSEKCMVTINGLFYSAELVKDTDKNYWSEAHPMLLYMAAMRYIEVANRNTQGVRDWEASILSDMKQLGMDLVEEIISEVDQMED